MSLIVTLRKIYKVIGYSLLASASLASPLVQGTQPSTKKLLTNHLKKGRKLMRKPMVTRTITTTKVNVLCLNIDTAEPFNMEVIVPRTFKDDSKLMKKVTEMVTEPSVKPVHIVDKVEVETVYGMSEENFIANAVELDPETRKALATTAETEEN